MSTISDIAPLHLKSTLSIVHSKLLVKSAVNLGIKKTRLSFC